MEDLAAKSEATSNRAFIPVSSRLQLNGKFLGTGDTKVFLRGVTYGPFRPADNGCEYKTRDSVNRDFSRIARNGINSIRTYTVPPRWLLDSAAEHGLRVMIGIPWEQHVTFLDERRRRRDIEERVRAGVREFAGHPAVLAYSVGNEIPAPIVRWYGRKKIERFIKRLYSAAKEEDPQGLVTYVNYPMTEYLQLQFLDFACFNVYLEKQDRLSAYLKRLQNIAGDRPLVMAEVGLDSRRNGLHKQAEVLDWQIRTLFEEGCSGAFIFSWTDEWHRGGYDIEDWDFGLTTRDRQEKPALDSVRENFEQVPFSKNGRKWPPVSVVVCVYNGASTLDECLKGLSQLDYPDYEVIVVDDGSQDKTSEVAQRYDVRYVRIQNGGLSRARNVGLNAAGGDIVAYIDADASPDPHWLRFLAHSFLESEYAGIGGPNIHPGNGFVSDCISISPGGPIHVMLTDDEAEHIPGCNMAFRRSALEEIGGFDPRFRIAGDDVDACWRMQAKGHRLGFSPAAMVWHYSRGSVGTYWKQQLNYGRAEALLERKWPEKYSCFGHAVWQGRIYGPTRNHSLPLAKSRVYHGVWGTGFFQTMYTPPDGALRNFLLMPEWVLAWILFGLLAALGLLWGPVLFFVPVFVVCLGLSLAQAVSSAKQACEESRARLGRGHLKRWAVTSCLHLIQPVARLLGRLEKDLHPWKRRGAKGFSFPVPGQVAIWSQLWRSIPERLESMERSLKSHRLVVQRGGEFDDWDLEAWGGFAAAVRVTLTVEEHGDGKQMVRTRMRPRFAWKSLWLFPLFLGLSIASVTDGAWIVCAVLSLITAVLVVRPLKEAAIAVNT